MTTVNRKAHQDEHGTYLKMNGSVYRPQPAWHARGPALVNGEWMYPSGSTAVKVGERVKAKLLPQSPWALVADKELWVTHAAGWEGLGPNEMTIARPERSMEWNGLRVGDPVRVSGTYARFEFRAHCHTPKSEWIEVFGGKKGREAIRAFSPEKVRPYKEKTTQGKRDEVEAEGAF